MISVRWFSIDVCCYFVTATDHFYVEHREDVIFTFFFDGELDDDMDIIGGVEKLSKRSHRETIGCMVWCSMV